MSIFSAGNYTIQLPGEYWVGDYNSETEGFLAIDGASRIMKQNKYPVTLDDIPSEFKETLPGDDIIHINKVHIVTARKNT